MRTPRTKSSKQISHAFPPPNSLLHLPHVILICWPQSPPSQTIHPTPSPKANYGLTRVHHNHKINAQPHARNLNAQCPTSTPLCMHVLHIVSHPTAAHNHTAWLTRWDLARRPTVAREWCASACPSGVVLRGLTKYAWHRAVMRVHGDRGCEFLVRARA